PPPPPGAPYTNPLPEDPAVIAAVGGRVFFTIGVADNGRQMWSTDGTPAGTGGARAFPQGSPRYSPIGHLAVGPLGVATVGGKLLFNVDDGVTGRQLWASDGTAAGTALVKQINPNTQSSDPRGFVAVGGRAYFVATDGTGPGVFVTD